MSDFRALQSTLRRIDHRGYKAYKDIAGVYRDGDLELFIDYVQGDPFAAPSRVRVRLQQKAAQLPAELFATDVRRVAFQDFLARQVYDAIGRVVDGRRGSGKSGLVSIDAGDQEVLERTAVVLTSEWVEARLEVGLPAAGRSVLGREAEELLCHELPAVAEKSLRWEQLSQKKVEQFVYCVENQEWLRSELDKHSLVAFVANGAVLPRQSGASDRPLVKGAVPFQSPESLQVAFELPNPLPGGAQKIEGMGIPRGITLIVGGGYHGKSTLLKAVERGVYRHIPNDGREYVVTSPAAVKIRAEDGRSVQQVDISPFISNLPHGRSTTGFSTDDASGSTSQAANIVEALEVGAEVLLLDEDTSATNFMVRDARMQALVHKEHEPITPFIDRVRELYEKQGVSTVLVMGGSGDYFDAADTVIMMKEFVPQDVTREARQVVERLVTQRSSEQPAAFQGVTPRIPLVEGFDASRGRRDVKISAKGLDLIQFGREMIDLRGVEQLVDISQTRAIGNAIYLAREELMNGERTLQEVLDEMDSRFFARSLDCLDPFGRAGRHPGNFARPRKYEIAAAINRLRTLKMNQSSLPQR